MNSMHILGTLAGLLVLILGILLFVLKLVIIGFIVYFFAAMGGVVPPVDFVPVVPYI